MARTPVRILISGCLIGWRCNFRGEPARLWAAGSIQTLPSVALTEGIVLVPVCPEQLGGLPTPRTPAELRGSPADVFSRAAVVVNESGQDVTGNFRRGAEEVLHLIRQIPVSMALLKDGSPSCGVNQVHAGDFDGRTIPGMGLTAWLLAENGVPLLGDGAFASLWERKRSLVSIVRGTKLV